MSQLCRTCGGKAKILDSRTIDKNVTRRRYRCSKRTCGDAWGTIEMIIGEGVHYKILRQELSAAAKSVSVLVKIRSIVNKAIGGKHQ